MKEKFYWKTSFWIGLYFFVTLIVIGLQMVACWVYSSGALTEYLQNISEKYAKMLDKAV